MQQKEWTFRDHSDQRLLDELKATHRNELSNIVKIIRILEEVDRRRLYAQLGYSSLFGFCLGSVWAS